MAFREARGDGHLFFLPAYYTSGSPVLREGTIPPPPVVATLVGLSIKILCPSLVKEWASGTSWTKSDSLGNLNLNKVTQE